MRPKSMATVVVVFPRMADRSSTPSERAVMTASVVSGGISETAPTKVVLPTPNPPATTILTGIGGSGRGGGGVRRSARAKSIEQPFQDCCVRASVAGGVREVYGEVAAGGEVTDQYPGHPDRDLQVRRQLRHRQRRGAELDDHASLRLQRRQPAGAELGGRDERLERQVQADRTGPAAGQRVRRHHPATIEGVPVHHRIAGSCSDLGGGPSS